MLAQGLGEGLLQSQQVEQTEGRVELPGRLGLHDARQAPETDFRKKTRSAGSRLFGRLWLCSCSTQPRKMSCDERFFQGPCRRAFDPPVQL